MRKKQAQSNIKDPVLQEFLLSDRRLIRDCDIDKNLSLLNAHLMLGKIAGCFSRCESSRHSLSAKASRSRLLGPVSQRLVSPRKVAVNRSASNSGVYVRPDRAIGPVPCEATTVAALLTLSFARPVQARQKHGQSVFRL